MGGEEDIIGKMRKLTGEIEFSIKDINDLEEIKKTYNLNVPEEKNQYEDVLREISISQQNLETSKKILNTLQRKMQEGSLDTLSNYEVSKRRLSIGESSRWSKNI